MIEIKHYDGATVLYRHDGDDVKEALEAAVLDGARLSGAWLSGAKLSGARLDGAKLSGAWLSGAWLSGAWLDGAWLSGARLDGAKLDGAWLDGAKLDWNSHDLVAELLKRAAMDESDPSVRIEKLKVAGLPLVAREWCWGEFLGYDDPLRDWALAALAAWVQDGDNAPEGLRALAAASKAAKAEGA